MGHGQTTSTSKAHKDDTVPPSHGTETQPSNLDAQGKHALDQLTAKSQGHGKAEQDEQHAAGHSAAEQLEHWLHVYSEAVHVPHLAGEALEKFAHIVGECGSHAVHEFLLGTGGKLCKGLLCAVAVPMALTHANEYREKAAEAMKEGNSTAATYYGIQAVFSTASAIPEVGLAFAFVSEMLQVSEGKGLVYEYLVVNIEKFDGLKLIAKADVAFANDTFVSELNHERETGSANLELISTGFGSREAALGEVRRLRHAALLGQEDYAVTHDPSGSFTVHALRSNQPIPTDLSSAHELKSTVIHHNNPFNIVAFVADDGSWGEVERHELSDGSPRWDIVPRGKV